MKSELCKTCIHTKVCMKDKNLVGDVFVPGNPFFFDNKILFKKYEERKKAGFPCEDYLGVDVVEVVRCKDCKWYTICKNGCNGMCEQHIDAFNVFYPNDYCSYGEREQ